MDQHGTAGFEIFQPSLSSIPSGTHYSTFKDGDSGRRCLRSTTSRAAIVQRTRTQLCHRPFSVCGATIWNNLPKTLRLTDNYQQFRRLLKTHLFNLAFN